MNTINPNYVPQSFFNPDTGTLTVDQKLAETVQAGVQAKLDKLPPVGDEAFLKQVKSLAPGDVDTDAELSAVLDKFEAAAAKLGGPAESFPFVGDIAKFIGRVMIEQAGQQRQQAADDRQMARAQAKAELLEQAAKQFKAGEQMMQGAIMNAVIGGLGAGLSFAGAMHSLSGQVGAIKGMMQASQQSTAASKTVDAFASQSASATTTSTKNVDVSVNVNAAAPKTNLTLAPQRQAPGNAAAQGTAPTGATPGATPKTDSVNASADKAIANSNKIDANTAATANTQMQEANRTFQIANNQGMRAQTAGQAWDAIGNMFKTVGQSADSGMQATAKKTEAEGTLASAESQYYQQIAEGKKEVQDAMNEMVKQIINFIKEMQEAEVDAMRALTKV